MVALLLLPCSTGCVASTIEDVDDVEALGSALSVPSYGLGLASDSTWTIEDPDECSDTIGAGGNLLEGGRRYDGKCKGAALAPAITGPRSSRALTFKTNPDFRYPRGVFVEDAQKNTWKNADGKTVRDRTELATPWNLPLDTDVWVGFELRIPRGTSDVTGSGAYLMQLWQCTANPIAGVRIQSGTGNGHHVQFVRRGEAPDVNYNAALYTQDVGRDEWHSFVVRYRVTPYKIGGPKGKIEVWHKESGSSDEETRLFSSDQYFGYGNADSCADGTIDKKQFRIKFGMYKDYQPGSTFRSDFRNVRIGGSKAAVRPY